MKLKNLYLLSITLLSVALTACSDDTETFDNQVYIDASVKTSNAVSYTHLDVYKRQILVASGDEPYVYSRF